MFRSKSNLTDKVRRSSVNLLVVENAVNVIFEFAVDQNGLWYLVFLREGKISLLFRVKDLICEAWKVGKMLVKLECTIWDFRDVTIHDSLKQSFLSLPYIRTRTKVKVKFAHPPLLNVHSYTTKYSSATTSLSTLHFTSPPPSPSPIFCTLPTPTPAKHPCQQN